MIRKNKIIIGTSILCVVALTLGLVLGGLDRLDTQNYGINYNYITANFSDVGVYQGGLHLVGPSNVLLEVPKTYRTIPLKSIKMYTQDFFPLEVSADASYKVVITGDNTQGKDFLILKNFYLNFGSEPQRILIPLMKNELIKYASSYNSSDYQNATKIALLESKIQSSIVGILNKWSNINVTMLLSSIVCKGIAYNVQSLNRKIYGLTAQSQRIQARKTDMTNFMNAVTDSTQLKMNIIRDAIIRKIASVSALQSDTNLNISSILQVVQATGQNLSFASSQLLLRPQLYLINNSSLY